jgi:hypothetical protein
VSDYIVNKAGAKVYSDVNKHAVLKVPLLKKESENGVVHDVLSVGMKAFPSKAEFGILKGRYYAEIL